MVGSGALEEAGGEQGRSFQGLDGLGETWEWWELWKGRWHWMSFSNPNHPGILRAGHNQAWIPWDEQEMGMEGSKPLLCSPNWNL